MSRPAVLAILVSLAIAPVSPAVAFSPADACAYKDEAKEVELAVYRSSDRLSLYLATYNARGQIVSADGTVSFWLNGTPLPNLHQRVITCSDFRLWGPAVAFVPDPVPLGSLELRTVTGAIRREVSVRFTTPGIVQPLETKKDCR